MWRLLALALLAAVPASAQTIIPSGSGSSSIASGTTACSGGADKAVFFNDGGVANCGSTTLTFDKTTGQLAATSLKSVSSALGTVLNLNNSVVIATDASNVLAIRNGATPQTVNVGANWIDASNYAYAQIACSSTTACEIKAVKTGSPTLPTLTHTGRLNTTDGYTAGTTTATGYIQIYVNGTAYKVNACTGC